MQIAALPIEVRRSGRQTMHDKHICIHIRGVQNSGTGTTNYWKLAFGREALMNTLIFTTRAIMYSSLVVGFLFLTTFPFVSVMNGQTAFRPPLPPVRINSDQVQIQILVSRLANSIRSRFQSDVIPVDAQDAKREKSKITLNLGVQLPNVELKEIKIGQTRAEAICAITQGSTSCINTGRIILDKKGNKWSITDIQGFSQIISRDTLRAIMASHPEKQPDVQSPRMSLVTIRQSDRALIPINHPWTNGPVINANLTTQHISRRLFGDNAPLVHGAFFLQPDNSSEAISFTLDPYWHRIVYGYKPGNWIRSYGDHAGEHQFACPKGMTTDPYGTLYVSDTENGRIFKFHYSSDNITEVSSLAAPGMIHPIDVSLALGACPSMDTLWVADDFSGKLFQLDMNGSVQHTVEYYTVGTQTHRLRVPRKVLATESWSYSLYPYVSFIDVERNAFVVADVSSISGTTVTALSSTEFNQSGSRLTSIGQDLTSEWWVTDAGLGVIHKFDLQGNYVASATGFTAPQTITKAPWYIDATHTQRTQYIYTAEPWGNTTGLRAFFPGADAVALQATEGPYYYTFSFVLTNMCRYVARIVRSDNSTALSLASDIDFAGFKSYRASKFSLGYGSYKLRVEVKPFFNSYYGSDSVQWLVREVPFNYTLHAPAIERFSQNPIPLRRGESTTVTCELSQGDPTSCSWTWRPFTNFSGLSFHYDGPNAQICWACGYNAAQGGGEPVPDDLPQLRLSCTASNAAGSASASFDVAYSSDPPGGCPFVYSWNGEDFMEDNNILPQSQYEGNEDRDVTDYYQLFKQPILNDGKYRLAIGEFEEEHSRVDQVRLLAIDHRPETAVTVDDSGRVIQFAKPLALIDAQLDSQDVLKKVSELDGVKVEVTRDGSMSLWFTESGGEPEQGLLLIGQAGPAASKEKVAGRVTSMSEEVASNGQNKEATFTSFRFRRNPCYTWVVVPARDTSTLQIDIQWKQDATVDYTEMSRPLDLPLTVATSELLHAEHSAYGDVTDLLRYSDEDYTELLPNERIDLEFAAPPIQEGMERAFVLVTRGRYDLQAQKAVAAHTQGAAQNAMPTRVRLEQNFPNPFNPQTTIAFELVRATRVSLRVYDVLGREVATVLDGWREAGRHEAVVDGGKMPSGIYFYRLAAGDETLTRKLLVMK